MSTLPWASSPYQLILGMMLLWNLSGPLATSAQLTCVGDCNHNNMVTVDEILTLVNIALTGGAASGCSAGDTNHDSKITVDEILTAVNAALMGICAADTPSPTSTQTPTPTPTATIQIVDFGFIGVVNELDRSVSFVGPTAALAVGAALPDAIHFAGTPRDIVVTPNNRFAYVTVRAPDSATADSVAVIDTTTRQVATMLPSGGSLPEAVTCTPDGRRILVTNFGSNSVSIIDAPVLEQRLARQRTCPTCRREFAPLEAVMSGISVGTGPNAIAVSADSRVAYVTNYVTNDVSVVDIAEPHVRTTVPIGGNPNAVVLSPDGHFAYTSNYASNTISIIDTTTMNTRAVQLRAAEATAVNPTGLSFTPQGLLYVSAVGRSRGILFGAIFVIDPTTNPTTVTPQIDFRDLSVRALPDVLPTRLHISITGDRAFVSNFVVQQQVTSGRVIAAGGKLLAVDTATNQQLETIDVGTFSVSLAVATQSGPMGMPVTGTQALGVAQLAEESCARATCSAPNVCVRDIGCHRNGCPPRDKCCPRADLNCTACSGGDQDGAQCFSDADCAGGGLCVQ